MDGYFTLFLETGNPVFYNLAKQTTQNRTETGVYGG